jgi:ribosomal protein S18 acetylase RimI-like enzyme
MIRIVDYSDKYRENTLNFILGILNKEFGLGEVERPDLYNIPGTYQEDKGNFWVAVENKDVIGTIALKNYGKSRGYIKRMYVDKSYRGTGLSEKLLHKLIKYARNLGYKELYLGTIESMVAANKFYQKHGFKEIDKLPRDLPDFGDTIFYKYVF